MPRRLMKRSTICALPGLVDDRRPRQSCGSSASVRFSRDAMSGTMPSTLRSSEQKPMPARIASAGSANRRALAVDRIVAALERVGAEDDARGLGAARSRAGPARPTISPVRDAERRRRAPRGRRSAWLERRAGRAAPADERRRRSCCAWAMCSRRAWRRPARSLRHLVMRGDRHRAAVAHDGDPVADGVELVEPVADEEHRHARRP